MVSNAKCTGLFNFLKVDRVFLQCLCSDKHKTISAPLSKNAVSANVKHIVDTSIKMSNFWSIHYFGKSLYVHTLHKVDALFSMLVMEEH